MRLLTDSVLLSDTIGAVYDCALRPERWPAVVEELAGLIGARRAFLGVGTATGDFGAVAVMHGIENDESLHRYGPLNPFMPMGLIWPLDRSFVASRDYGLGPLRATRYYREYLAPRGDLDAIVFVLTREGSTFGHWLLVTQEDRAPITEDEAAGMDLIAPHVRRAVEISSVLGARCVSAETYRAALDQLESLVLIIDGERRVTYANPRAEAELSAGRVLRLGTGGHLLGATEALDRLLRRAQQGGAAGLEARVEGTHSEEYLFFAVSLDLGRDGGITPQERSTLLVLRSPREDTHNPITIAARVFGLTPAQVQVLTFLAQGHAPDGIAGILGLSIATVRTHLADLFHRTGTSRQAELVARTLSFASPVRTGASTR